MTGQHGHRWDHSCYETENGRLILQATPIDARLIADFIAFRPNSGRKLPVKKLRAQGIGYEEPSIGGIAQTLEVQTKQHDNDIIIVLGTELLELLSWQIMGLEEAIQTQIMDDSQMRQHAKILRSIPGIGPVLCAALIGEMPELSTIGDKQIAALARVARINRDRENMQVNGVSKAAKVACEGCCIRLPYPPLGSAQP